MKYLLITVKLSWTVLVLMAITLHPVYADSASNSLNLSLPSSGSNYQSDKFRAGDLECSNAIGSATQWEFGVTGIIQGSNLVNNKYYCKNVI